MDADGRVVERVGPATASSCYCPPRHHSCTRFEPLFVESNGIL